MKFRRTFLIGCFLILICIVWFALGCEGEQGITGAQGISGEDGQDGDDGQDGEDGEDGEDGDDGQDGDDGEDGEDGVPIILISGRINSGDYVGDFAVVYDDRIAINDVVQVYLNLDPDRNAWVFMPLFAVTSGSIGIYDPDYDYIGYLYIILVIKG